MVDTKINTKSYIFLQKGKKIIFLSHQPPPNFRNTWLGRMTGWSGGRQYNSICSKIFWDFIDSENIKFHSVSWLSKRRQRWRRENEKRQIKSIRTLSRVDPCSPCSSVPIWVTYLDSLFFLVLYLLLYILRHSWCSG